jgi:FlaA1/EpsC-like NDP-sugar epimerase
LMGERLMTAANAVKRGAVPIFSSTRFGNVLGSRGSVIPLFKRQIASGGPVTLTDPAMTRFIMTLRDAVQLVKDSVFMAKGGEVFVTKMPVVRIEDLARVMIEELAPEFQMTPEEISVEIIGSKAGEKIYEELLSEEETRRTLELKDFYVVMPAFRAIYDAVDYEYEGGPQQEVKLPYNSANAASLGVEDLRAFLRDNSLLEVDFKP